MKAHPDSFDRKSAAAFLRPMVLGLVMLNLLVAATTAWLLYESRIQYDVRVEGETRNLARVLEQSIDGVVDRVDLALLAVVDEAQQQLAAGAIDAPALNAYIARQFERQPELNALRVSDAKGLVRYGIGAKDPSSPVIVSDRGYFRSLRDDPGAGLVFSQPVMGQISGQRVIALARRIQRPDGAFGGVAYAAIPVEYFYKMFSAIDIGENGAITLRSGELTIVARYPDMSGTGSSIGSKVASREFKELVEAGSAAGTYAVQAGFDQVERIYSFRRIGPHPWIIIVGLAKQDYLATWRGEVVERAASAGLFAVVSVLWAWLFYRGWVRRGFADRLEHQVNERTAQLRAMAIELSLVEERERQGLAQDLHDGLGQTLAIAKLRLSALEPPQEEECQFSAELKQEIASIEALLDEANRTVRSLSLHMSPPVLRDLGLASSLQWLADEMHRSYGLRVNLHLDQLPDQLDEHVLTLVFRATRELLINVARHACVDVADVAASCEDGHLVIVVSDSGAGFDPANVLHPSTKGGYGLFSVRERINYIGGDVQIDASPGDGTVVVLTVPLTLKRQETST
ncbi:MAG: cache domain-containing protein [Sterolibacterium sp.]|jgi:signal transduction histidine kinase